MSGIAACLRLDGSSAQRDDLTEVLNEMRRRGPEGEGRLTDGPVALGHRLLATTPEAVTEPMPLRDTRSGCCITADARLDNREELFTAFGLNGSERQIGDGALILHAWEKWGEDCPRHLLGDFAFLIWDPRRQQLFGARDQMGMRQLIYAHRPGKRLVCATSANAVVAAPCIERRLNELRVAESLVFHEQGSPTSTFYEDVFRLAPGHTLSAQGGRFSIREYWRLEPVEPNYLKSNEEYAEAFNEVFRLAIRARIRSAGGIGSMLSGGIDSGATTAIAADESTRIGAGQVRTYSVVGPDSGTCHETRAVQDSLAIKNIVPTMIYHCDLGALVGPLIETWKSTEEPFEGNMNLVSAVYMTARKDGIKVVLDGSAADNVLSSADMLPRLAQAGRFLKLWREACGLEKTFFESSDYSAWRTFSRATMSGVAPSWVRAMRRRYFQSPMEGFGSYQLVNMEYAERVGLLGSLREHRLTQSTERLSFPEKRVERFQLDGVQVAMERYDRAAAAQGVEPRNAFMDLRVLDFAMSLPMEQIMKRGVPKVILRRAMKGLIPEQAIWRPGKSHHGPSLRNTLVNQWPEWERLVARLPGILQERVDWPSGDPRLQAISTEKRFDPYSDFDLHVLHAVSTSLFLDRTDGQES